MSIPIRDQGPIQTLPYAASKQVASMGISRPSISKQVASRQSTRPVYRWFGYLGMLWLVLAGCRQLPKELPTTEREPAMPAGQRLHPHDPRTNPLLPLPMKSLRDLRLSLRNRKLLVVPPPTFRNPKLYPCSGCHTGTPNRTRRKLTKEHKDHKMKHGGPHMWCFHCHSPSKVDRLRLADDTTISFKSSHLLCFQCHGDKAREWIKGVHGRTTGYWKGPQRYLLCTHCHDPHNPKPRKYTPMPMPRPPHLIHLDKRQTP